MDMLSYQTDAMRTIPTESDEKDLLTNFCFGLFGEGGEFVDHIKKHLFHGHDLDDEYIEKELGDLLWYINGIATVLGFSVAVIARKNIEKLEARYPEGFTKEASRKRTV